MMMAEPFVPEGVLAGNWEFVYAAYILFTVVLVAYGVSVFSRYRRSQAARRARD